MKWKGNEIWKGNKNPGTDLTFHSAAILLSNLWVNTQATAVTGGQILWKSWYFIKNPYFRSAFPDKYLLDYEINIIIATAW